jgi:hypothetical protein
MLANLGKPFDQATPAERIRAYVAAVDAGRLTRADLALSPGFERAGSWHWEACPPAWNLHSRAAH